MRWSSCVAKNINVINMNMGYRGRPHILTRRTLKRVYKITVMASSKPKIVKDVICVNFHGIRPKTVEIIHPDTQTDRQTHRQGSSPRLRYLVLK